MAGSVGGYDSAAAEAARRAAEEEARRRAEEEARRKAEEERKAKEAQEAQEAKEAEEAREAEEVEEAKALEGSVFDNNNVFGVANLTEAELKEQAQEWEDIQPRQELALGFLWPTGEYSYTTSDGSKITVNNTDDVHVRQNKITGEIVIINADDAKVDSSSDDVQISFVQKPYEKEQAQETVSEWAEAYGVDTAEILDENSEFNQIFTQMYGSDINTYYYDKHNDAQALSTVVNFMDWYNTSYKDVNSTRQEMEAVKAFGLTQGYDISDALTLENVLSEPEDMYGYTLMSIDYRAGSEKSFGYNQYITGDEGILAGASDYNYDTTVDSNGNTVSTVSFKKDGQEVVLTTVFDGNSTRIKSQTQDIAGSQTSLEYGKDGSFVVKYPDGTDKTSAEIALARINSYGKNVKDSITGNNALSSILSSTQSAKGTYDILTAYCGGDKETARKLFNSVYAEDGLSVDNNFVLKNSEGEEISEYENNPLYMSDQTEVTSRLYDYRAQDRVLSSNILQQFSTTNTQTVTIDGQQTDIPSGGKEYYIDATGQLCLNEYSVQYDENSNLIVNSTVHSVEKDTVLYSEIAQYYSDASNQLMVDVERMDNEGQTVAQFSETSSDYNKRIFVERNYALDRDNNGITELNIGSGEISQLYSLMLQDSQYEDLIKQFGEELNSQGIFDNIYNALRGVFGASNADKLTAEISGRSEMTPVLENFISGNREEALEATEQEFARRLKSAQTMQDIYDTALEYYGSEDVAGRFTANYLENNSSIVYSEGAEFSASEAAVNSDGTIGYLRNWTGYDSNSQTEETRSLSDLLINTDRVSDLGFEKFSANAPSDFQSLYKFWSKGGEYSEETIKAYNEAGVSFSAYNEGIISAQNMETALYDANSPEEVFKIFEDNSGSKEEAVANFNNYYANLFDTNGSIPLSPAEHLVNRCNGITAQLDGDSVTFNVSLTDADGNEITSDVSDVENVIGNVNAYVSANKLLQKEFATKYKEEQFPDMEIPEGEDSLQFITQKVNDEYFTAYENLYGDSELKDILENYCEDMDSYARNLTQIMQLGSLGLSFVCPAFGYVAIASGFIDNIIDYGNMATNNQSDNYDNWFKKTGMEMFCVAGGMTLGGLCNLAGGKVTNAVLNAKGADYALTAHIAGTSTEVVLDVASGMAFDYATNMAFYGQADWNLSGNTFSGFLDVISGIRGYHARAGALDMTKMSANDDFSTITVPNASGKDVEFKCVGVDSSQRLVYADSLGRIITFDNTDTSFYKPSEVTPLLGDVVHNPQVAQRLEQNGLSYNPKTGSYTNSLGNEVKIETTPQDNGLTAVKIVDSVTGTEKTIFEFPALVDSKSLTREELIDFRKTDTDKPIGNRAVDTLSGNADELYGEYTQHMDEARTQIEEYFDYDPEVKDGDIAVLTGRQKSENSIYEKLSKKMTDGKLKTLDMDSSREAIGDAYGTRIQVNDLSVETSTRVVNDYFASNNIDADYDTFVRYLDGDTSGMSSEMVKTFDGSQKDILNALKTEHTQVTVDKLCDAITNKGMKITELNNYGGDISAYFTPEQVTQIAKAYEAKFGEPLKVTTMMDEYYTGGKYSFVDENGGHKPTTFETKEAVYTNKGAVKDSGYASAQMNVTHTFSDGSTGLGELQIRGTKLNEFADVEHIPYDIRSGKIKASDAKYAEVYDVIHDLSPESYTQYNKYLTDVYNYHCLEELGIKVSEPKIPDNFTLKDGKKLTPAQTDMWSESGLVTKFGHK